MIIVLLNIFKIEWLYLHRLICFFNIQKFDFMHFTFIWKVVDMSCLTFKFSIVYFGIEIGYIFA